MLNTNSTITEPKVKELLLERRHSICLEISKKRRQSVPSSIFIPKDHIQAESRLKTILESGNKPIFTSRNKKCPAFLTNKKRVMARKMSKKKLKHVTISQKNQTSPTSLKHPESYPIVKQTISSEKVRCVVESLRVNKVSEELTHSIDDKYSETCERSLDLNLFEGNVFRKGLMKTNVIKTELGAEGERQQCLEMPSNAPTQANSSVAEENNVAESKPSVFDNDVHIMEPQIDYTSINKVDNFVVIVDARSAHVEIKCAGLPSPSRNENATIHNRAGMEEYIRSQRTTTQNAVDENDEFGYIESNNCPLNTIKKLVAPPFQSNVYCTNISTKHTGEHAEISLINGDELSSKQDGIIDLSIKEAIILPSSGSEVINGSLVEIYPQTQSIQRTTHGHDTHLLIDHQAISYHRKLHDRCRNFGKNTYISSPPTCCYNYRSTEPSTLIANSHETQSTTFAQPHLKPSQKSTHLDSPQIISRNQQLVPTSKMAFPIHVPQQKLRKESKVKSNKRKYGHFEDALYPYVQHVQNQLPHCVKNTLDLQRFDNRHLDQIQPDLQHKQLVRPHFPQYQYYHREQSHLGYAFQINSGLDLPRQFYNPLHQNFLSYSNQSRTASTISAPSLSFEPKESWRFSNRANINPPVRFDRPQNYLPTITNRCFPYEQAVSTNLPFPSPNWTNTLYNCPSLCPKSPTCCNIETNPYPIQSRLPSETEPISSAFSESTTNALRYRKNGMWDSAYLHTQVPSHFHLNYL